MRKIHTKLLIPKYSVSGEVSGEWVSEGFFFYIIDFTSKTVIIKTWGL